MQAERRPNSQVSSKDRKPHDGGEQLARDVDPRHKQADPKAGRQSLLQLRRDEGESGCEAAETGEPPGMAPRVAPGRPGEQGIARETTDAVDDPAGENPAGAVERNAYESHKSSRASAGVRSRGGGLDGIVGMATARAAATRIANRDRATSWTTSKSPHRDRGKGWVNTTVASAINGIPTAARTWASPRRTRRILRDWDGSLRIRTARAKLRTPTTSAAWTPKDPMASYGSWAKGLMSRKGPALLTWKKTPKTPVKSKARVVTRWRR